MNAEVRVPGASSTSTEVSVMPSGADTATLAEEAFISITTFKRDGTPVATPVWCARENGWLLVYTGADSGR